MATKYCEDCKFLILSPHCKDRAKQLNYAKCGAQVQMVSREMHYDLAEDYATTARTYSHLCGRSGKWFQAKSAEDAASVSEAMPTYKSNLIKDFAAYLKDSIRWFRDNWK